ncbi:hypothetical protein MMC17_002614 [Xylographa soralifera]|nr:hypothetical protein [Xylographa soralifera]
MAKVIGFKENVDYVERREVTIIVMNQKEEIVIVFAQNGNYYKFPGGGVEADEDHQVAVQREMLKAIGCEVTMEGGCMATTEEWRDGLHQISYCYRGRLMKDTGMPELKENQIIDGLKHEWISLDGALENMKTSRPTSQLGRSIKERDLYFVETYAKTQYSLQDSQP